MADLKLELALSSGIPEAYTATLKYLETIRETTDPDIRRRQDLIGLAFAEWFWFDLMGLPRPVPVTK